MKKILLVIDSLVGAGAQRQLTNLAVGLNNRGHEVTVFFYHPKHDFLPKLKESDVAVVECRKKSRFDLTPIKVLRNLIQKKKPDSVISFLRTPSIYCEVLKLLNPRTQLIVSERISVLGGRLTTGDIAAGVLHIVADVVNSNSRDYLEHLTNKLPFLKRKSSVIYNGIEPYYFASRIDRSKFESQERSMNFAVVAARCTEIKGAIVVAEAAKKLYSNGVRNFKINWIGPVDFDSDYVKVVLSYLDKNNLESIWNWTGKSNDIIVELKNNDVLISASFQEGISNVICEAMSLGLPVIVSNVSDNSYILGDGQYGALFSAGDPEGLSRILDLYISLTDDQLIRLSELAHERASELFSMDRMISEWEELIGA